MALHTFFVLAEAFILLVSGTSARAIVKIEARGLLFAYRLHKHHVHMPVLY